MSLPVPYHTSPGITLYAGDAVEVLAGLPDASAACVVTSPPYWGALRDYDTRRWAAGIPGCRHTQTCTITRFDAGTPTTTCRRCGAIQEDRQYGHEPTPDAYIAALRRVFTELARVLAPTGTVWLNLGDCHAARHTRTHPPALRSGSPADDAGAGYRAVVRAKSLYGMPWRVAFALQDDGWIIRNAVVWHKPNGMPEPVTDRLTTRYELVFLLVRQPRYYFDLNPIREPAAAPDAPIPDENAVTGETDTARSGEAGRASRRRASAVDGAGKYTDTAAFAGRPPGAAMRPTGRRHTAAHPAGRNPGDVWSISTRPLREAHFAAFPIDLPLRAIAAGCPPGGVVLDPFSGAATTGLAARHLDRRYIGIDLNPTFHDIGLARLGLHPPVSDNGDGDGDGAPERSAA
ncbi:site-specific DNA-methyltransferase [Frankia sp. Cr1]|uniref:DNA-methyltransferase n=1 Tax=Frankia sp. Cr1 TaxID=3073931 RepID=UPI002AD2761E|nr:site-specific DNA-methyltransferase [Frankia sp. Cr1]